MNHHHKNILKGLSVNYKNWDHKLYIKLYNISKFHNLLSDLNAKILRYFAFTKSTISGTILGPSALQNFYANLIGSFMARYICQFVTLLLVVYHRASWKSLFLQFIRAQFAYQYVRRKTYRWKSCCSGVTDLGNGWAKRDYAKMIYFNYQCRHCLKTLLLEWTFNIVYRYVQSLFK